MWDDGLPGHAHMIRFLEDEVGQTRTVIVLSDSARFLILRTLATSFGPFHLASGIAQSVCEDVNQLIESLLATKLVEFVGTQPVSLNSFLLAVEHGIPLEDAVCLYLAAVRGHALYVPRQPTQAVIGRIKRTYPDFQYDVVE